MKSFSTRRLLLLALLAPLFTLTALADDPVEVDGICYTLVPKGKFATVARKMVQKTDENGSIYYEQYSGSIVIPDTITVSGTTYSVIGIENFAFNEASITSITIPESVTSIGEDAFNGCYNLTSITIPNSITSINSNTFSNSGLTSIIIPNSVTSIGFGAFSWCSSLTSVTIPNTVTSIGGGAFSGCNSLTSIDIPSSVTSIGGSAFSNSGLTSIIIPNSVTSIDDEAFLRCSNMTSVTILNSVTSIGRSAFYDCSSLTSVTIPNSVTVIDERAFQGCEQLRSVTIENDNQTFIKSGAFANCPNLEEFSISTYYYDGNDWVICTTWSDLFDDSFVEYATLYVPASAISLYQAHVEWGQFGTITALGSASKYYKLFVDVNAKGKVVYSDGVGAKTISGASQTFDVKENENIELTLTPNTGYKLGSITVNGVDSTASVVSNKLTIASVNSDQTVNVKFVLDASSVDVTIGELGAATFFCDEALDFSGTNDVKAYIASAFNPTTGQVTLTRITDVPARTGIVLLGNKGTYSIPLGSGKTYVVNMLVGVDTDKVLNKTEGANSNFILSDGENGVEFYPVKDGSTLAAGKAYLTLPTAALSSNAQSFSLRFGDATGIENPTSDDGEETGAWFTLDGRRLDAQPTAKGLYIVNGKKVMVR